MDGFLEFVQVNSRFNFFFSKKMMKKCLLKGAIAWYQWVYFKKTAETWVFPLWYPNVIYCLISNCLICPKCFSHFAETWVFHPRFLSFTSGSTPWSFQKPWGTSLFFGAFVVPWLGKKLKKKNKKGWWKLGWFFTLLINIFLVLGVTFTTRQDATVKYVDLLEFLLGLKWLIFTFPATSIMGLWFVPVVCCMFWC